MTVVEATKRSWTSRFVFFSIFSLCLALPAQAWAVQQHGGLEGMVVHQLGHLLSMAGMFFLLYRMGQPETRKMTKGSGWFEFKLFIWLIILWNALTFYGHWHQEIISPDKFVRVGGKITAFLPSAPVDALFYGSRLDHLVLLPAFLCLLQALRKWRQQG